MRDISPIIMGQKSSPSVGEHAVEMSSRPLKDRTDLPNSAFPFSFPCQSLLLKTNNFQIGSTAFALNTTSFGWRIAKIIPAPTLWTITYRHTFTPDYDQV